MKIIVIGGTGTIGKAVVKELAQRHEVIAAEYKDGDILKFFDQHILKIDE